MTCTARDLLLLNDEGSCLHVEARRNAEAQVGSIRFRFRLAGISLHSKDLT